LSRGGEDGDRSRELMQQFSVLHYFVLVHIFVNKAYIAVLQFLVKLRPISRTPFGHESDTYHTHSKTSSTHQNYCSFIKVSLHNFAVSVLVRDKN